mmetsp:Transcript_3675/g.6979  ORF Transcript_3675/g.6979 Transcript_3675/m.6979 type:complete len:317 (-) Transcript_3675:5048-5998(-)
MKVHIFLSIFTTNILLSFAFSRTGLAPPPKHIWPQLVVGGQEDPALAHIENNQRKLGKPYGDFLDAGTGIYSLRWIAGLLYRYSDPKSPLAFRSFVAVTADANFQRDVQAKAEELEIQEWGSVRLGNWAVGYHGITGEEVVCENEMFDTILADYLVGAVDYFAPFYQDLLLERLARLLRPGGVMYLTGLNPIPEKASGVADTFCRVTKLRDACILLARSRPYREHPTDWVVRHLEKSGLDVLDVATFPRKYNYGKIKLQLDEARSTLQFMPDKEIKEAISKQIDNLDDECKKVCESIPNGEFELGFDWVITAIKKV